MLPLLVLLGTIAGAWYLLIVRPQKHQQTRHGALVERLQVGDHVLTVGGIYGRVVAVEGPSVVLELAPGLSTRIATDGVARIVQAAEAALPTSTIAQDAHRHPLDTREPDMQDQQPHDQYAPAPGTPASPQFAAPAWVAPPVPYQQHVQVAQPMPVAQPVPVAQAQPAAQPAAGLRAHVVGSSIPTFEPRPWGDLSPIGSAPAPQPIPVHTPFASAQPMPVAQPVPVALPMPVAQPMPVVHQPQPVQSPAMDAPARRHSQAPSGMGSSLRLDDPSLRDTMARARDERSGLADEYRRLTAPLVDTSEGVEPAPQPAHAAAAPGQVLVGHDPNGVPLFAAPGAPVAHPVAPQYPAPARVEPAGAMPRPVLQRTEGAVDPALTSAAFQRRAPYAPQVAVATDPALQAPAAVHAGAH
jgi:preprotein translocase YajC subunit